MGRAGGFAVYRCPAQHRRRRACNAPGTAEEDGLVNQAIPISFHFFHNYGDDEGEN
jgi:hypothetical protein